MIPKNLKTFINQVQLETEKGTLAWSQADSLAFFCDHKNHTLHITPFYDDDRGYSTYYFRIVTNGKSSQFSVRDDEEDDFSTMRHLYEAVIISANNVVNDISNFFD